MMTKTNLTVCFINFNNLTNTFQTMTLFDALSSVTSYSASAVSYSATAVSYSASAVNFLGRTAFSTTMPDDMYNQLAPFLNSPFWPVLMVICVYLLYKLVTLVTGVIKTALSTVCRVAYGFIVSLLMLLAYNSAVNAAGTLMQYFGDFVGYFY